MPPGPPENWRAPVAIVGAGPVGLSLALGLARHGVRSVLIEKKPATNERSRAPGVHIRTREVFRQWGIEERIVAAGVLLERVLVHSAAPNRAPLMSIDFTGLDNEADRPGVLILEQGRTEKLLLDAVRETGVCDVRFGAEAVALAQKEDGAHLTIREGKVEHGLAAEFVAGCDGASSFVREALGLPFDGFTYSIRPMLADVQIDDERDQLPCPRLDDGHGGITAAVRLHPGLWRIIRLERGQAVKTEDVPVEEVDQRVSEVIGKGSVEVVWASRFRIHLRSSPQFRVGRVLLAGDAAHIHSPAGGQGMNAGIHDAHNLAWKLAAALGGGDTERLLDSYDIERRAVAVESVSRYTDHITRIFLQAPPAIRRPAFFLLGLLLAIPAVRTRMLRRTTMIDLAYPASPLLRNEDLSAGLRLPNPLLRSPEGAAIRLYDLLPNGPVMLDVAETRGFADTLPVDNVIRIGRHGHSDPSGLLRALLGGKDGWILVRPDAYVAWARHSLEGVAEAVSHALGRPPRAA